MLPDGNPQSSSNSSIKQIPSFTPMELAKQ